MRKLKNGLYSVKNSRTGKVHSLGSTKTKAEAQIRLLQLIDSRK